MRTAALIADARLTLEFMALANHNLVIRAEIAATAEAVRRLETQTIGHHSASQACWP